MRGRHSIHEFIAAILAAIDSIDSYVRGQGYSDFLQNEQLQDAVCYNFIVIGEASRDIQRHHPDIAAQLPAEILSDAYRMRNWLAHGYLGLDLEIIWRTIQTDLPRFHLLIESIDLPESQ